jgi:hypothetical protein
MLIAGSTNLLSYTLESEGEAVTPDSVAVAITDASGDAVTFTDTPVAAIPCTLTLGADEVPVSAVGTNWSIAWTVVYNGQTLRDVEVAEVAERAPAERTLGPLATSDDLTYFRYGDSAEPYLGRASARVRGYLRQDVSAGTSTHTVDNPYRLPQRPVNSITSCVDEDGNAVTYTLKAGGYLDIDASTGPVTVNYAHGFSTLPDELIEIVCAVAARMANAPTALENGVQSEALSGGSVTWGSSAYAGVADLTPNEKAVLDRIYPKLPQSVDVL